MKDNLVIEYRRRFEELKYLLEKAFIDVCLLRELEKMKLVNNIVGHIYELVKSDLALIVWKMYYDTNPKANTLKHLHSFVKNKFGEVVSPRDLPKMSIANNLTVTGKQIESIRKSFLAHNDIDKKHASVNISQMIEIVDSLQVILNGLCFPELNDSVSCFTREDLDCIQTNVANELQQIFRWG